MTSTKELQALRKEIESFTANKPVSSEPEYEEVDIVIEDDTTLDELQISDELKEKLNELVASFDLENKDSEGVLTSLLKQFKQDYENISPTSAIALFSLGALFGHAISSK